MVKGKAVQRGEVWLGALDPTVGREIQKTRPCLIVSPDSMNAHLFTVTILPLTTGSHPAPFRVPVDFNGKKALILPDQMRTLDKSRLRKRVGKMAPEALTEALAILRDMFEE